MQNKEQRGETEPKGISFVTGVLKTPPLHAVLFPSFTKFFYSSDSSMAQAYHYKHGNLGLIPSSHILRFTFVPVRH